MVYLATNKDLMKLVAGDMNVDTKKSTFIILSPNIDCGRPRPNVIQAYTHFFSMNCLKGASDPRLDPFDGFKKYLLSNPRHLMFIMELIQSDLLTEDDTDIFLLIMESEKDSKDIGVFVDVIYNLFKYRIQRYPELPEIELEECLKRILYYIDATDIAYAANLVPQAREDFFSKKDKKDLKRLAKKLDLYVPGSSKGDLVSYLTEGVCNDVIVAI